VETQSQQRRSESWREALSEQYTDPRNGKAAERLAELATETSTS
jgi:hypothetical protein